MICIKKPAAETQCFSRYFLHIFQFEPFQYGHGRANFEFRWPWPLGFGVEEVVTAISTEVCFATTKQEREKQTTERTAAGWLGACTAWLLSSVHHQKRRTVSAELLLRICGCSL